MAIGLPRIEIVVTLVDRLGELLDASRVVLLVDCDQLLRERVEQLDLVLVLVELSVERLRTQVPRLIPQRPSRRRPARTSVPIADPVAPRCDTSRGLYARL